MKRKRSKICLAWMIVLTLAAFLPGCSPAVTPAPISVVPTIVELPLPGGILPRTAPQNNSTPASQPGKTATHPGAAIPPSTSLTQAQSAGGAVNPSSSLPALDAACPIGIWQVTNLPEAMSQSLTQSSSSLQLRRVDGNTQYEFTSNGNMTIHFDHLAATLVGTVDNRPVTAVQSLDGSASALYQVDPSSQQILLYNFGGGGVQFGLDINGQRLIEGTLPVWQAFTSGLSGNNKPAAKIQSSRVAVACSRDTMRINSLSPLSGPQVNLQRVK